MAFGLGKPSPGQKQLSQTLPLSSDASRMTKIEILISRTHYDWLSDETDNLIGRNRHTSKLHILAECIEKFNTTKSRSLNHNLFYDTKNHLWYEDVPN